MMIKTLGKFKKVVAVLTSWSLAIAPLSLLPQQAIAQASVDEESTFSKAVNLEVSLDELADRASYPNIPRRGIRGIPSQQEVQQIESRLSDLHKLIKNLPNEVNQITDESLEALPFLDIQSFYTCASKFEGLKILLGQNVDLKTWDARYNIEFSLNDLAQLRFIEVASLLSATFVKLPAHSDELLAKRSSQAQVVRSKADLAKRELILQLSPQFLEDYERMSFLNQMNTKSSLMFATHFAVHRLFDSLTATRLLMNEPAAGTPEVPAYWTEKFPSLRVKRAESILRQKTELLTYLKPQLLEVLKKAFVTLEGQNQASALDENFFKALLSAAGLPPQNIDLTQIRNDETSSWTSAVSHLTNLWNLNDLPGNVETLIFESKRLSLRWLILANETWAQHFDAEAKVKVGQLIDERARTFAQNLLRIPEVHKAIADISISGPAQAFELRRSEFQKKLTLASTQLKQYETSKINLRALMTGQQFEIEQLVKSNSSPIIKATLDGLSQAQTYENGYWAYRQMLYSILQAYVLPQPTPWRLTITYLESIKKQITFNPASLQESMPQKYIDVLKANTAARNKDVSDLLELGRILKFDTYEKIAREGKTATPQTLELKDNWISGIMGSEKRSYLQAFKNDIVNNAPILGSIVASKTPVWEYLAAGHLTAGQQMSLISTELKKIPAIVSQNLSSLQVESEKLEAADNDSLNGVGEEIRTLVTRASQLSFVLSSFSGFSSLHEEVRKELLLPGFWGREWKDFSSWSGTAMTYMLGFFLVQIIGSRVSAVGRASDSISKFLIPVFGPNFSRLNVAFWGILGIGVSESAYRGFITEPQRGEILKHYFECNAGGPCVALYSDVNKQNEITRSARFETVSTVAMMALIMGGFYLARKVLGRFAHGFSQNNMNQLRADIKTLQLNEAAALNEKNLQEGLVQAVQKARSLPDPVAAELAETYARQAANRIQSTIWKEASRWNEVEARFEKELKKLNLSARESKNMQSVNAAFNNVEALHARGAISTSEYQELKSSILSIFQTMQPTWAKMDKNPLLKNFYEKVWDTTSGTVRAEIRANRSYYDERIVERFMKELDKTYGSAKGRQSEAMLENMIKEIQQRPETAKQNLQRLRELLRKGAKT